MVVLFTVFKPAAYTVNSAHSLPIQTFSPNKIIENMAKASKKAPPAAAAVQRFPFQYAAKFICMTDIPGTSQQSAGLLPGNYQTIFWKGLATPDF